MAHGDGIYIGGSWIEPVRGQRITLIDPSTEDVIGEPYLATAEDVPAAVDAAEAAFPAWSALSFGERADVLDRIAHAWERRAEEISVSVSREMGMPIANSRLTNGIGAARNFRYYAQVARAWQSEETREALSFEGSVIVRSVPVGVVAAIAPWNYACYLIASKVAPALAAGCTVVLKPAVENALTSVLIAEVMEEAGVPAGVVNVVVGTPDFGAALVAEPRVASVAFTGSTAVGKRIGSVVGERLASTNLELGGKSAAIVLDDADLEATLRDLPALSFRNSGQTCFAQTRVIATAGIYDRVVDGLAAWANAQVLGSAFDDTTTLGPLGTANQRAVARRFIESGLASGARLVAGGLDADVPSPGYFVRPTVFADVDNTSELAQEEVFGPVICVIKAQDDEDAIRLANQSRYGLAGTVWTTDIERGTAVARRMDTGSVGINGFRPDMGSPFGGVKDSGSGRENGREGLAVFLRSESIYRFGVPTNVSS